VRIRESKTEIAKATNECDAYATKRTVQT